MEQLNHVVTLSRELTSEELAELKREIYLQFPQAQQVEVKPMQAMGMTGAEIVLSIVVSFATSLAANATYDLGKYVVSYLLKRGVNTDDAKHS